jgi:4-amino-4-deoxy-L-arabinose transferase-like glycosyltransferase
MPRKTKIQLPFSWLSRYTTLVGLVLLGFVAAFFRLYQLGSLPPGLDETSARIGLQALKLSIAHPLPTLDSINGYAPLWVWLQALSIQIFGNTALALRIWPAVIGILAVLATWFWIRSWFGARTAWITAFFVAVSPWAVTLSRNGIESALLPLLVPLTLWTATRALRHPGAWQYAAFAAVLVADLLSGPIGWVLAASTIAIGTYMLPQKRSLWAFAKSHLAAAVIFAVGAGLFAFLIGTSLPAIKAMPQTLNISDSVGTTANNLVKVLSMFNIHGDENYRHNLAGEPMLNAFIGIMMIAGLLVSVSRLHQKRYRALIALTVILVLPAMFATVGVPNSSWAVGALPLIFALAGLGTSYMLELWYTTFPINSAARTTGLTAIVILMFLSAFQGYTQYFRAWAGSSAVHAVFNEGTVGIANHLGLNKFNGERYVVIPATQVPIVEYLDSRRATFRTVTIPELEAIPIATANRQFYIATSTRDDAVKVLKAKFPGGTLRPHFGFNLTEIYYTYEVAK